MSCRFTGGDVIERDAGAVERLLDGGGDPGGVSVSGDGDGPTIVHLDERGANILRDGVGVAHLGHVTILYVPPHRRLRLHVLLLRRQMQRLRSVSAHSISTQNDDGFRHQAGSARAIRRWRAEV